MSFVNSGYEGIIYNITVALLHYTKTVTYKNKIVIIKQFHAYFPSLRLILMLTKSFCQLLRADESEDSRTRQNVFYEKRQSVNFTHNNVVIYTKYAIPILSRVIHTRLPTVFTRTWTCLSGGGAVVILRCWR